LLDGHADVNRAAPNGATPLMMAAGYGYTPIVELLLRGGADPRLAGPDHDRPLDWALTGVTDIDRWTYFQCQTPIVRALLVAHPDRLPIRPSLGGIEALQGGARAGAVGAPATPSAAAGTAVNRSARS
jgi:hypothetical protein